MTPYTPGTRVVLRIPDPVVGVVRCLTVGGMVVVDVGDESAALSPGDLMPAMPRDEDDLKRWGWWWWVDGDVVEVAARVVGLYIWRTGVKHGCAAGPDADWRGPVAPPPEVRS